MPLSEEIPLERGHQRGVPPLEIKLGLLLRGGEGKGGVIPNKNLPLHHCSKVMGSVRVAKFQADGRIMCRHWADKFVKFLF